MVLKENRRILLQRYEMSFVCSSMSQRAADKARRATFAPLILSENAGRTDESTLNNIKQDYIESDEPNSSL